MQYDAKIHKLTRVYFSSFFKRIISKNVTDAYAKVDLFPVGLTIAETKVVNDSLYFTVLYCTVLYCTVLYCRW